MVKSGFQNISDFIGSISVGEITIVSKKTFVNEFEAPIASSTTNAIAGKGKGKIVEYKGQTYYENIGQKFDKDEYFWSRPSAVDYNAAGSGASNKGASNKEYLQEVEKRIETILKHNPEIKKSEIPMDLITASGSGLDPNISVQAAKIQIKRISKIKLL